MKKIQTLFLKDFDDDGEPHLTGDFHLVTTQVRPGCEWVLRGEGVPTRMWDGYGCLLKEGKLFARMGSPFIRGRVVLPDEGFILVEDLGEHGTVGWIPVTPGADQSWFTGLSNFVDALLHVGHPSPTEAMKEGHYDGTYELCGPGLNGNHEGLDDHQLIRHGEELVNVGRRADFDTLAYEFENLDIEGIVWWNRAFEHLPLHERPLAKVRRADFGHEWPPARDRR